jgi:hypothetical protein
MNRSSQDFRNGHGKTTAIATNGRFSRFGALLFVLVAVMLLATSLLQAGPPQHGAIGGNSVINSDRP